MLQRTNNTTKNKDRYKLKTEIIRLFLLRLGSRGGLMVSALVAGSSGPGSSRGRGHCVVFLGKTLYSGELNAGGNPAMD